jgi:hypothetical protein
VNGRGVNSPIAHVPAGTLRRPREFTIELMAATKRHIMQKVPL